MVTPNCETETILTQDADESTISKTSSEGNCLSRLRRWFIVEPILILYVFGVFPVQTIAQKYILHRITNESLHILTSQNISDHPTNTTFDPCHSNTSDPIYQFQEYVQSKSSQFVLYESIINGVPAIFVTIILGAGSDIFGRRFAILPPLVGALLGSSIYTYVICTEASIHWLFVGDAVIGCCGSFYAVLMGCLAYVADRTPPEKLMIRITIIELTMFIPGVISPIVCGKVTTAFGYLIPLLFIIAASAVNLVYALIFLPNETKGSKELHVSTAESLPECPSSTERSSCFSVLSLLWIRICSMVTLFTDKSASTDADVRCGRMRLNLLIASFFVTKIPVALYDVSKKTLFMMNSPLCWDLDMIGLFSGVTFAVSGVGAIIVTPLFKCCGIMEYVIAILAGLVCTATNVYTVFVKTTVMMFLSELFNR